MFDQAGLEASFIAVIHLPAIAWGRARTRGNSYPIGCRIDGCTLCDDGKDGGVVSRPVAFANEITPKGGACEGWRAAEWPV